MIKAEWTNADALDLQPTCNQLATDLISRQAVIDALTHKWDGMVTSVFDVLKELPSAQAERKKGKWINHQNDGYVDCPFCGALTTYSDGIEDLHFCFSCGAELEGEQE